MNFHPILWGNNYWNFLYLITLGYPENPTQEDKNIFSEFFTNLVLPCKTCQND